MGQVVAFRVKKIGIPVFSELVQEFAGVCGRVRIVAAAPGVLKDDFHRQFHLGFVNPFDLVQDRADFPVG